MRNLKLGGLIAAFCWVGWGLLGLGGQAFAHEGHSAATPAVRSAIAATAAADGAGRIWWAWADEGHVYVQPEGEPAIRVNEVPEAISAEGENRPRLAFGLQGEVHVSWAHPLKKRFTGEIRYARSDDGGRHFSAPRTIHQDRREIGHSFNAMAVDAANRLWLAWIDKRDGEDAKLRQQHYAGAAIYVAVSDDGGRSFQPDRKLDDHSCECCRLALAVDAQGRAWGLWRALLPPNVRDHKLAPLDGVGAPVQATDSGWRVDACPHHGPALAFGHDGVRHLAWFSGAEGRAGLFYSRLDPDGKPLGDAQPMGGSGASHPALLAIGPRLWRAWKRFDGGRTVIEVQASFDGGLTWQMPQAVATTAGISDHPQLLSRKGGAVLAWRTADEGFNIRSLP